jgi:hypothetical protein
VNLNPPRSALTPEDVSRVSPALANYTRTAIQEGVWKRPALSPRDRGIVTVAALIARNQTIGMLHYFNIALDNDVNPASFQKSSHTLRSTPDGRTPFPRVRSRRTYLNSEESALTNFRRCRLNYCR